LTNLEGVILAPFSLIFRKDGGDGDNGFLKNISSVLATFRDILLAKSHLYKHFKSWFMVV
jgi:hypothetical protein